jgi:hypothetical protein
VRGDGAVLFRPLTTSPAAWQQVGVCPPEPRALAIANDHLFVLDASAAVHSAPQGAVPARAGGWGTEEKASGLGTLTALSGRLVGIDRAGRLVSRPPGPGRAWVRCGHAAGCVALTGHAGALYGARPGFPLRRYVPVFPVGAGSGNAGSGT